LSSVQTDRWTDRQTVTTDCFLFLYEKVVDKIILMTVVMISMVKVLFCCYIVMLKDLMAKLKVCIDFKMKMKQNTKVLSLF